jgi:GR25 family glycosyltransferase involved in LPS biosynthesis
MQQIELDEDCKFCKSLENIWNCLDSVYVICLKDREDRFQKALIEVHRTGLCQIAKFYRPSRSSEGFVSGCWDSHVQVATYASSLHQNTVMVLEDDFELDKSKSPQDIAVEVSKALGHLPLTKWTRLSMGQISWFKMYYASGVERSSSVLTHAQIWSSRGLQWMMDHPYDKVSKISQNLQVDGFISFRLPYSYSMYPMVAYQRNEGSDRTISMPLQEETGLKGSEIWIPFVWVIGIIIGCILFVYLFHLRFSYKWSLFFTTLIFVVPFTIVWILILSDVI